MTSTTFPGAVFLLSGGISFITLSMTFYIHFSLKGKKMVEVTRIGAGRLTDEEKEQKRMTENRKFSPETFDAVKISYI